MTGLTSHPGVCRNCDRRREVYSISRSGGGTYRRGGRTYWSSICGDCAVDLLPYVGTHAGSSASRFSGADIRRIAAAYQGRTAP